jgi:nucleoid DNA-binding protein
MEINKYISALLHKHDCVIIPGFGGFVCSYQPAEIHPGQHSFHPPSKKILFNNELKANDGLLASHIAIESDISFDEALGQIEEVSAEMILRIENGERVKLDKVGVIYTDNQGNIQFDQDKSVNYLEDAFGLATFVSPPVQRHHRRPVSKPEPKRADRVPEYDNRNLLRAAYWTTGIAATFLLFGIVFMNYDRVNNFLQNETGFFPSIGSKTESAHHVSERIEPEVYAGHELSSTITQPIAENPETTELDEGIHKETAAGDISAIENEVHDDDLAAVPETPATTPAESPRKKMYHLIAGSFESAINAESLIAEYSSFGYTPEIIGQASNGYFRVSIAAYLRKEVALDELNKARNIYNPNIWLLRQ